MVDFQRYGSTRGDFCWPSGDERHTYVVSDVFVEQHVLLPVIAALSMARQFGNALGADRPYAFFSRLVSSHPCMMMDWVIGALKTSGLLVPVGVQYG